MFRRPSLQALLTKVFLKLMSFTCAFAWLCAEHMVPLMLFIWALETKKPELTDIEVMAGAGKRLLKDMELTLQQLDGGV